MVHFQGMTSSPLSFHSSYEFTSSPVHPAQDAPLPVYRTVKILPNELREHCRIYFEETLYNQALNLLTSLLSSGNNSTAATDAFLPPHQHLALAATLAIHPTLTTRAKSAKQLEEADAALRYLRLVLEVVGPINGNLQDAFVFSGLGTSSRRGGSGRRRETGDDVSSTGDSLDIIENDLAQSGAIWTRAEDIWQVIGWAFNCSILHKKRWDRWHLWLDFMLDVLQRDWEARGAGLDGNSPTSEDENPREKSMIVRSLNFDGMSTRRERKILRAIFADGSPKAATEFPEIWKNETKERKKDVDLKKIETKIDIEADNYGDYMDDDDDDDADSDLEDANPSNPSNPPPASHSPHASPTPLPNLALPLGGPSALQLRLRLLSLLTHVSATLPKSFIPPPTLHDTSLEHIRPLPLPTFFLILSPPSLHSFPPPAASSLTQSILHSLITSTAPLPTKDALDQATLQESYLPFAANTALVADNAKVSICIETLIRLLDRHIGLSWSPALQDAADRGILARNTKATKPGRKKAKDFSAAGGVADDGVWLRASAERIRCIVHLARP